MRKHFAGCFFLAGPDKTTMRGGYKRGYILNHRLRNKLMNNLKKNHFVWIMLRLGNWTISVCSSLLNAPHQTRSGYPIGIDHNYWCVNGYCSSGHFWNPTQLPNGSFAEARTAISCVEWSEHSCTVLQAQRCQGKVRRSGVERGSPLWQVNAGRAERSR